MFVHHRTNAFILKEAQIGEADKIFTLFTEDFGKIDVLAKSIRKIASKLKGGTPLFSISEIGFIMGRSRRTLTDAVLINGFEDIKQNLENIKIARDIAWLIDNLIKGPQKDDRLWQLLLEVFAALNEPKRTTQDARLLYHYFFWKFISFSGYSPELYRCLVCRQRLEPRNLYFSSRGGIICSSCEQHQKAGKTVIAVEPNAVRILREILINNFIGLGRLRHKEHHIDSLDKILDFYLPFLSA